MLSATLSLLLLAAPQEAPATTPASLLSKAILAYHNASTLSGTVVLTQTALNTSIRIESTLNLRKPNFLHLVQRKTGGEPALYFVTTDGTSFTYNRPLENPVLAPTLEEPCVVRGKVLTAADMWLAASQSLGDRTLPLILMLGTNPERRAALSQLATLELKGTLQTANGPVTRIGGDWRVDGRLAPTGTFAIDLAADNTLLRYETIERIENPQDKSSIEVRSVWDINVKLDQPIPQSVFTLMRVGK